MADLGATSWSETDASNNASPPNGWPEGMNPSDVNNAARANMGGLKRAWDRSNAVKTTAGTTTAYTLTYDVAAAAYYDGEIFAFVMNATCGAAPTLNINGLGARNLRTWQGTAFGNATAGELLINQTVQARYNLAATTFDIISPLIFAANTTFLLTSDITLSTTMASPSSIVNTGSIGGNGQMLEITAIVNCINAGGGNSTAVAVISNGSIAIRGGEVSMTTGFAGSITMVTTVTLSGATTFTVLAAASAASTVATRSSINAIVPSLNDKMTSITWKRLA